MISSKLNDEHWEATQTKTQNSVYLQDDADYEEAVIILKKNIIGLSCACIFLLLLVLAVVYKFKSYVDSIYRMYTVPYPFNYSKKLAMIRELRSQLSTKMNRFEIYSHDNPLVPY